MFGLSFFSSSHIAFFLLLFLLLRKYRPTGKTLVFVDFLGCPQRPFAKGQMPRTKEQEEEFARALKLFPNLYPRLAHDFCPVVV